MFIGDEIATNLNTIIDFQQKRNKKFVIDSKIQLFDN